MHRQWRWEHQAWSTFTGAVIPVVLEKEERVVFILWGNDARRKAKLIEGSRHAVIEQVHPSPLSAYKGFFDSKPFTKANDLLGGGDRAIDWAQTF